MTQNKPHMIFINQGDAKAIAAQIAEIICAGHSDFFAPNRELEHPPVSRRPLWQQIVAKEDDVSLRKAFHILQEQGLGEKDLDVIRKKLRSACAEPLNQIIETILAENPDALITKEDVVYNDLFEFGVRIRQQKFTSTDRDKIQKSLQEALEKALNEQVALSFKPEALHHTA